MPKQPKKPTDNPSPGDAASWNCKCGKPGFVYVEKVGAYLCRDHYIEHNKKLIEDYKKYYERS